jgi:hypothetical protein
VDGMTYTASRTMGKPNEPENAKRRLCQSGIHEKKQEQTRYPTNHFQIFEGPFL